MVVLLARAAETGATIVIPGAHARAGHPVAQRQVRLARLVRQPTSEVVAFGRVEAFEVRGLLAAASTSDVVDAHVVLCARRAGRTVVTSGPDDLRLLDGPVGRPCWTALLDGMVRLLAV